MIEDGSIVAANARQLGCYHVSIAIAQLLVAKGVLTNREVFEAIEDYAADVIRGTGLPASDGERFFEEYMIEQMNASKRLFDRD